MFQRTTLAALLIASAALGEERFGARGQVVPLGSVSYAHISLDRGVSGDIVDLAPEVLWFPTTGIALGGSVHYQYNSGFSQGPVHTVGFEPLVGVGLPVVDRVALFPRVGINFTWFNRPYQGTDGHSITFVGKAPVLFFPAPHYFIGFGPQFSVDLSNSIGKQAVVGVTSEFGGYF